VVACNSPGGWKKGGEKKGCVRAGPPGRQGGCEAKSGSPNRGDIEACVTQAFKVPKEKEEEGRDDSEGFAPRREDLERKDRVPALKVKKIALRPHAPGGIKREGEGGRGCKFVSF